MHVEKRSDHHSLLKFLARVSTSLGMNGLFFIENFSASGYDFFLKGVEKWNNFFTQNR
jgi:hypothetical protein